MTRHQRWVGESGVSASDRNIHEHEVLSLILHHGCCWDGLNAPNIAALETAARRLQLIEEAVAENPSQPSWEGSQHYMGRDERRGGALMAPSLRTFVAGELGKEAAVQKRKRKAREARGPLKGRGKGKDGGGVDAAGGTG